MFNMSILNFDPQKGMKGYFAFHVSVRDGFGHADKATVQIYLLREDQRVRFVFRSQPAEIRARINRFREVLGKVTDSIVNVDQYLKHQNVPIFSPIENPRERFQS